MLFHWIAQLRAKQIAFKDDERGVVAVITAFLIVLLIVIIGMGIDFGRAFTTQQRLYAALDTAGLAAATRLDKEEMSVAEAKTLIKELYIKNIEGMVYGDVTIAEIEPDVNMQTGVINLAASANVPTFFIRLANLIPGFGEDDYSKLNVGTNTTVNFGVGSAEIALVLDVTLSMKRHIKKGKADGALETAVKSVIDELLPPSISEEDARISLSIIPYNEFVSLPLKDAQIVQDSIVPLQSTSKSKHSCMVSRQKYIDTYDNETVSKKGYRQQLRFVKRQVSHADEIDNFLLKDDMPPLELPTRRYKHMGHAINGYGAFFGENCKKTAPIRALTSNRNALSQTINLLDTENNTAGHIGMLWGWHTLSPKWNSFWQRQPNSKPAASYGQTKKFMIFMTDGKFNSYFRKTPYMYIEEYGMWVRKYRTVVKYLWETDTYKFYQPYPRSMFEYINGKRLKNPKYDRDTQGNDVNIPIANYRAKEACKAIRESGITIFSVFYQTSEKPPSSLLKILRDCAGKDGKFVLAKNADDLKKAFSGIAKYVKSVYVSK